MPLFSRTATTVLVSLSCLLLGACIQLEGPEDSKPPQDIVFGKPLVHAGEQPLFAIGPLSGTGGIGANGLATTQELEDASFAVTVRMNISPAATGSFYKGWLTKPDGSDPIDLGQFENPLGDGRHEIRFHTAKSLYRTHTRVVVSLEKKGTNQTPGTLVAVGMLKPITR
jgi:hypothetical protein